MAGSRCEETEILLLWHDSIMFFVVDYSSTASLFPLVPSESAIGFRPLTNHILFVFELHVAQPQGCSMTFTLKGPTSPLIHGINESDTANKASHQVRRTLYVVSHVRQSCSLRLGSDICFLTQRRDQTQPIQFLLSIQKSI